MRTGGRPYPSRASGFDQSAKNLLLQNRNPTLGGVGPLVGPTTTPETKMALIRFLKITFILGMLTFYVTTMLNTAAGLFA